MNPESWSLWVDVLVSTLLYFALIPGLFFAVPRTQSDDFSGVVVRGILWFLALSTAILLIQKLHPMGGLWLCSIIALYGWWQRQDGAKRFRDVWVYLVIWPASLLPITQYDALHYQLRIPRSIHRIGLSVVDGTDYQSQDINALHWFLSAFGFSDKLLNVAAIAMQAFCLVLILRMFESYAPKSRIWKWALLGMPLTVQLTQEAWVDISCSLMLMLFAWRCHKGCCGLLEAFLLGFMFHFKLALFIMALPMLLLMPWKSWLNSRWLGVAALPILGNLVLIWGLTGYPLTPYIFTLPVHPEFHETFQSAKLLIDEAVHKDRWDVLWYFYGIFYMTCPLLLPAFILAFREVRVGLAFVVSFVLWMALFPQLRFTMYLVPAIFLIGALQIRKGREAVCLWVLSLFLLFWRGAKAETQFWKSHDLRCIAESRVSHPFSRFIGTDEKFYSEADWGWDYPGHAVAASVLQFRYEYSSPWLEQFRRDGIRHVIVKDGYRDFFLNFGNAQSSYRIVFERLDRQRRKRIDELTRVSAVEAHCLDLTLYRLPNP
ncbi:MAG: hypothetical protein AB7F75_01495 [Planctomycetota bacterium]